MAQEGRKVTRAKNISVCTLLISACIGNAHSAECIVALLYPEEVRDNRVGFSISILFGVKYLFEGSVTLI